MRWRFIGTPYSFSIEPLSIMMWSFLSLLERTNRKIVNFHFLVFTLWTTFTFFSLLEANSLWHLTKKKYQHQLIDQFGVLTESEWGEGSKKSFESCSIDIIQKKFRQNLPSQVRFHVFDFYYSRSQVRWKMIVEFERWCWSFVRMQHVGGRLTIGACNLWLVAIEGLQIHLWQLWSKNSKNKRA